MNDLPAHFAKTIIGVYGPAGATWLDTLHARLARILDRYDLTLGAPFDLSYNYVTAATRSDGTPVVLKLGVPDGGIQAEIAALRHYDGNGMVALLEADSDEGLMILERVLPGT